MLQRLKLVKDVLGFSNVQLAECAGCSSSHISKIFSGKREFRENGAGAEHLTIALIEYAKKNGRMQELCALCGGDEEVFSPQELLLWLCGEGSVTNSVFSETVDKASVTRLFSERFDRITQELDLSNIRLSKLMNVDASLISRFRNGKRSPQKNAEFMQLLCEVLTQRMHATQSHEVIAELVGCDVSQTQTAEFVHILEKWFFAKRGEKQKTTHTYDYLKMFLPLSQLPVDEMLVKLSEYVEKEKTSTYWGLDGMRNAILRLLTEAAMQGDGEIYMYADQSLQWLLADEEVLHMWYLCCSLCISRGVKLIVIHDINRKIHEMANAMQIWVPLFMTGHVEPYYCTLNRGSRFTHMLFLRPNHAALSSLHVHGTNSNHFYDYIQDAKKLNVLYSEFKALLANSEKLVQVFAQDNMRKYYSILKDAMAQTQNSLALLDAPPSVTVPDDILHEMFERSQMSLEERELILSMRKNTYENLQNGSITELFELPDKQKVKDGQLYLCLGSSLHHGGPGYSVSEYRRHIENIIRLCETDDNYNCCVLSKSPFPGMRIILTDSCAVIIRLHKPYTAFLVENPFFTKSFAVLLHNFYEQNTVPRERTVALLKKHLEDLAE
ncbi:MAG: helix-turn-helix transcriptional regulator [Ruminococcaceae bacterium]|nr:helix-turn-helix transcriptional regulator [Oscillospiraceae bacterium]